MNGCHSKLTPVLRGRGGRGSGGNKGGDEMDRDGEMKKEATCVANYYIGALHSGRLIIYASHTTPITRDCFPPSWPLTSSAPTNTHTHTRLYSNALKDVSARLNGKIFAREPVGLCAKNTNGVGGEHECVVETAF